MSKILTTGPMKIPGKITGDSAGGPPEVVRVSIKNPTTKDFRIQLFAEVCYIAQDGSGMGLREEIFPDDEFLIPANNCRNRTFPYLLVPEIGAKIGDQLRFFAKGDLDKDAEKLELSFVGQRVTDGSQMNEPTMFFRHADLLIVKNKHTDQIYQNSISTSSTDYWEN
ncbi:hypothetical protein [Metabacillus litoralis]|jgi:hypothetical protein|uniref:hypothetical protein n=1 Tax=Metabacillus litoralis TaxID=152268 RepID=UPI00203A86F5|nr:hypothetical protein [Metabacillus litoralis]MCM3655505.1 hypothetical protein [Metabacillus litoralis]